MLWLNKHARFRGKLSPYIDGRLTPGETGELEAHLAGCDACRRELDELRATASVLRELPQAEPRRSFALTPGMLERRATPRPSAPPLAAGMRLASAAVAVALTVVAIGDLSMGGGTGDEAGGGAVMESPDELRTAGETGMGLEAPAEDAAGPEAGGGEPEYDADAPRDASSPPAAYADGCIDTLSATGAPEEGTSVSTPTPAPGVDGTSTFCAEEAGAAAGALGSATPEAVEAQLNAADEAAATASGSETDDGGISALNVAEIVLAGALIALLTGITVELALRRRRVA